MRVRECVCVRVSGQSPLFVFDWCLCLRLAVSVSASVCVCLCVLFLYMYASLRLRSPVRARRCGRAAGVGELHVASMVSTRFQDLRIRLGAQYVYCHQGNCEHIIVFMDMRCAVADARRC